MNRVLVTGGAGFIGSNLCEHLLRTGRQVVIVDVLDDFYDPQLKRANLEVVKTAGDFEFYPVDIRDSSRWRKCFKRFGPMRWSIWRRVRACGLQCSIRHSTLR